MNPKQIELLKCIDSTITKTRRLPKDLRNNSEYGQVLNFLFEARAYATKLHIKKPERFYGRW